MLLLKSPQAVLQVRLNPPADGANLCRECEMEMFSVAQMPLSKAVSLQQFAVAHQLKIVVKLGHSQRKNVCSC